MRQVQQQIDELTDLDRILYDAGVNEFEKVITSVHSKGTPSLISRGDLTLNATWRPSYLRWIGKL